MKFKMSPNSLFAVLLLSSQAKASKDRAIVVHSPNFDGFKDRRIIALPNSELYNNQLERSAIAPKKPISRSRALLSGRRDKISAASARRSRPSRRILS